MPIVWGFVTCFRVAALSVQFRGKARLLWRRRYKVTVALKNPPDTSCAKGCWSHVRLWLFISGGSRVAIVASSSTFFQPFCVHAEQSTPLMAFRPRASFLAVSGVIVFCLFLKSFSVVEGSSLRSVWVPRARKESFDWWVISGTCRVEWPLRNRRETHLFVHNSVVVVTVLVRCSSTKSERTWLSTNQNRDSTVVGRQSVHTQMEICYVGCQGTCFTNGTIAPNSLNCLHCWNSFLFTEIFPIWRWPWLLQQGMDSAPELISFMSQSWFSHWLVPLLHTVIQGSRSLPFCSSTIAQGLVLIFKTEAGGSASIFLLTGRRKIVKPVLWALDRKVARSTLARVRRHDLAPVVIHTHKGHWELGL